MDKACEIHLLERFQHVGVESKFFDMVEPTDDPLPLGRLAKGDLQRFLEGPAGVVYSFADEKKKALRWFVEETRKLEGRVVQRFGEGHLV